MFMEEFNKSKIEDKDSNFDNKIRIRTKKELEIRKDEFLKICKIFDKIDIRYFLQTGALLGAIRENDFIHWDWDVEIAVFTSEFEKKIDLFINEIKSADFEILHEDRRSSQLKIDFKGLLPTETTKYSINGWSHDKDKKIYWRKRLKVPDYFWNDLREIELFGKQHLAPYPPEKYLEYHYGDWKTPLRSCDKSKILTTRYSGRSPVKMFLKKLLKLVR